MKDILIEYEELLATQVFDPSELDYSKLEYHKEHLTQLARISNSGITIFDMHRCEHVFTSPNFAGIFGYCKEGIDERVHPDERELFIRNGVKILKYFTSLKVDRREYKVVNEFRILNAFNEYVRVIEQFTALELDSKGDVWLSLSVLDMSPDQSELDCIKSKILNYKTGDYISTYDLYPDIKDAILSTQERRILQLVKDGKLSKEISEHLFISVHTVNTHRQRILGKLNVDNSMEAVKYASRLGLLE